MLVTFYFRSPRQLCKQAASTACDECPCRYFGLAMITIYDFSFLSCMFLAKSFAILAHFGASNSHSIAICSLVAGGWEKEQNYTLLDQVATASDVYMLITFPHGYRSIYGDNMLIPPFLYHTNPRSNNPYRVIQRKSSTLACLRSSFLIILRCPYHACYRVLDGLGWFASHYIASRE